MAEIKELNSKAFDYLDAIPITHWSRHEFSFRGKPGMLLNNCCESFNNVLKDAREKPILSLMEWIKRYTMKRCCAKRERLKLFDGLIMPSVVKMTEREQKEFSSMRLIQVDFHEFEVDYDGDTFVVNMKTKTCGCYRWTLMGIPCWHLLACIAQKRLNYEDFVHSAYYVKTYAATYAPHFLRETVVQITPATTAASTIQSYACKAFTEKRKKEFGEKKKGKQVKRARKQNTCGRCGGLRHNKKNC
ncbi:uncharacterized protein [Spinacia oleracea]|uniref:SWIM-type domain-containing protein n=1 Tax=Spinacia oleracea TaxID=3562 RepID=A0A9R0IZ95_SPIOL|nr:uncharacterized protein LOC110796400 [Spinacia oleracea]